MPAKINKETINISNSLEVLDQKIKELETSLVSLKEDQNDLRSKIKPYKDNSVSCITKDGIRELTGDWDIGDSRKIFADEIRARDGAGLKLYDDGGNGIFVKDGGNVGIGTDAPTEKLHVKSGNFIVDGFFRGYPFRSNCNGSAAVPALSRNSDRDTGMFFYGDNKLGISTGGTDRLTIDNAGNIGLGTLSPSALLDINSDILRLRIPKTPASAGASGNQGDFCWDTNFIYICTATNTWKRVAIATW